MSQGYVQPRIILNSDKEIYNQYLHLMGKCEVGGGQERVVLEGYVASVGAHHNFLAGPEFPPLEGTAQLVSVSHALIKC